MDLDLNPNRYMQHIADTLMMSVQYMHGNEVAGDIAEFGTASGTTARILAYAMASCEREFAYHLAKRGLPTKHLHLFDSFQGLPAVNSGPDIEAPLVAGGTWHAGSCRGLSAPELRSKCAEYLPADRIDIFVGWYKDTVSALDDDSMYGLLHIDCDLYQSTMDVLVPLLERGMIAKGAVILFDDWNCNLASPEFGERRAWADCVERFKIEHSDGGDYAVVGHKFIVHGHK